VTFDWQWHIDAEVLQQGPRPGACCEDDGVTEDAFASVGFDANGAMPVGEYAPDSGVHAGAGAEFAGAFRQRAGGTGGSA
jgi:hypothetical protein